MPCEHVPWWHVWCARCHFFTSRHLLRQLQAFKQPFTAALCSPGVNNSSSKFTAVISRTNRLLRAHLATYGCEGLVAGQLEQQAAGQQQQRHGKQQQLVSVFWGVQGSMEVGFLAPALASAV